MSDAYSATLRSSPALDRAVAEIEATVPASMRRYNIILKKNGARRFLKEPWALEIVYVEPPLMRRLQAELVHRYWRRFA